MSLLKKIKKEITIASESSFSSVTGYIDTGSYIFNALISGSIHKGMADNKITALAGESGTGKSMFALGMVSAFLKDKPDAEVIYFDTEYAITNEMLEAKDIDLNRFAFVGKKDEPDSIINTVEKFRDKCYEYLDIYTKTPESEKKPLMIVLDSLGMLSTNKEIRDVEEKSEKSDMGARAKLIKSIFTTLAVKSGIANVPIVFTNHVYNTMGSMYPTATMNGGQALRYAASTVVFLSKRKDKNSDGEVVGNIIHCNLYKGRFTKENKVVDVRLNYNTGLDRYYGLVDLGLESGVFKKNSTRIVLPDGTSAFEKHIYENPKKYFTPEVLDLLDKAASKVFMYGSDQESSEDIKEALDGD
jgi:RecA/RadA recombinase